MHRIDGPAAAPGGLFTEGDPSVGTPATIVSAAWLNAVQEELIAVINGAGMGLAKADNGQLLKAIAVLTSKANPVGQVISGYFVVAPAGYLLCDGSLVSRTTYAALFVHANTAGMITSDSGWAAAGKSLFGSGDGSTSFRLPDLRGEFIRGADLGRGVDAGRSLGSWQAQQLQLHKHLMPWGEAGPGPFGNTSGGGQQGSNATDSDNDWWATNDGSEQAGAPGNPPGVIGAETRPRNVALTYCVRY